MNANTYVVDPAIKQWAATDRQREFIDAVNAHGSGIKAAKALGVDRRNIDRAVRRVEYLASTKGGYSPEHGLDRKIAPGYLGKGHSILDKIDPATGEATMLLRWTKTKVDDEERWASLLAALDTMASDLAPRPRIKAPAKVNDDLANFITFTDYHLGMLAHAGEAGADWNMEIAEKLIGDVFALMLEEMPPAHTCIINIQGDFLHTDGLEPVTPRSKHVLDASARYPEMARAAMRIIMGLVEAAAAKHKAVRLLVAEGNHDLSGTMWLRMAMAALYSRNPRVEVIDTDLPYYAMQWGETMIGIHHGHLRKLTELRTILAAKFPRMWGTSRKRYGHMGHFHMFEERDEHGMLVTRHPTLAADDAHAARGGYVSERGALGITYHKRFGEWGRRLFTPEMVS